MNSQAAALPVHRWSWGRIVPLVGVFGAVLAWSSWPALSAMLERWSSDPRYSHGYLVPGFAVFLLWHRRDRLARIGPGIHWGGLAWIALGVALQFLGGVYFVQWLEMAALLPILAGLCLLAGGWPALSWAWPAIAFLFFMIPLPYRVEYALGYPLQRIATLSSTFLLQTFGLSAVAEGNIIVMDHARIGVVEACNGLGMIFMFLAFSTAVVLLIERPVVDKMLILLGAIPTALLANILRITITGLLHETVGGEWANAVYHELAGWLMMPLALGLLWLELVVLSHLFVPVPERPLSSARELISGAALSLPTAQVEIAAGRAQEKPTRKNPVSRRVRFRPPLRKAVGLAGASRPSKDSIRKGSRSHAACFRLSGGSGSDSGGRLRARPVDGPLVEFAGDRDGRRPARADPDDGRVLARRTLENGRGSGGHESRAN